MRQGFLGVAFIVASLAVADPVFGQTTDVFTQNQTLSAKAFGDELIRRLKSGDYEGALEWLEGHPDVLSRDEGQKLQIQLLMFLGRDRQARALSETYLSGHPNDATARFQLAELHFRARQDQAAAFAYRLALAGNLDEARRTAAYGRLEQIEGRKRWRYWVGGSVAPDSNLNSATNSTRVDLFGLPFELSDDARRRSGVSVNAFGGIDRIVEFTPSLGLRLSTVASVTDLPGNDADLGYLSLRMGPQWRLDQTTVVSVQVKRSRQWYGGEVWEDTEGIGLESDSYSANRRWTGALNLDRVSARLNPARGGHLWSFEAARTQFLGNSSLWRLGTSVIRREAKSAPEAYLQGQLSIGRLFQGPKATFIYTEASVGHRRYDAEAVAFRTRRIDREASIEVRLSKRDWFLWGGHPFVSVSASQNRSSINLYEYDRTRVEFGFTREF